jgi:hypothetical protein
MSCERNGIGVCGSDTCKPECPPDCPKLAIVQRLKNLTGGKVELTFSHNEFFTGDEDAMGHLYSGWLSTKGEEDFLTLDDRMAKPLEVQIVAELRRLAAYCNEVAEETEQRIEAGTCAMVA